MSMRKAKRSKYVKREPNPNHFKVDAEALHRALLEFTRIWWEEAMGEYYGGYGDASKLQSV